MSGSWNELAAGACLAVGAFLLVAAAIGVVRMPDTYTRMSAASKASSLGASLVFLAIALAAGEIAVSWRALLGILFLLLTTPVASHMLGRAAYLDGAPKFEGTVTDELAGRYEPSRERLRDADGA